MPGAILNKNHSHISNTMYVGEITFDRHQRDSTWNKVQFLCSVPLLQRSGFIVVEYCSSYHGFVVCSEESELCGFPAFLFLFRCAVLFSFFCGVIIILESLFSVYVNVMKNSMAILIDVVLNQDCLEQYMQFVNINFYSPIYS